MPEGTNISFMCCCQGKARKGNLKQLTSEVRNIHGVVSELILCMLHKGQEYCLVEVDTEVTNQWSGIVVVDVLHK